MAEVISFDGESLENVKVRYYREVSRNYLLKVIKQQKEQANDYPISNYSKNLEKELADSGFFDKYNKVNWWRQETCQKSLKTIYTPIID